MASRKKLSNLSIGSLVVLAGLIGYGGYQYLTSKAGMNDAEFGSRVRGYLMANPEVLRDVIGELQAKEQQAAKAAQHARLDSLSGDLHHDPDSYVAGNPDGDVTIVEFFDYRCGYCKKSYPDVMKTVADDGNIRLVLKEFPILGDQSVMASQAAIAAHQQGKYIELHDALMAARGSFSQERIMGIAGSLGIDTDKLLSDMQETKIRDIVTRNYALAKKLGINGTPAFIIGDTFVPGVISADQMKRLVASAREAAARKVAEDSKS